MGLTGIYLIKNRANQKVYIGKSIDIMNRWKEHMKQGENSVEIEDKFHFDLYRNPEQFEFSSLEICNEDILDEREKYYIDKFNSIENGYNKIAAAKVKKKVNRIVATNNRDMVDKLNEIIGKPLFKEDKDKLAIFFGYRDKRGNLLGWTTVKKNLIRNGFEVKETKRIFNGKPKCCSIISVKFIYKEET